MKDLQFFIFMGEARLGPLPSKKVHKMIESGEIRYSTLIWHPGLKFPIPVGEVDEFSRRQPVDLPGVPARLEEEPTPGPTRKRQWFIFDRNEITGPFTPGEIENKIKNLEIRRSAPLWREGQTDWQKLLFIPEFEHLFHPGKPPFRTTTLIIGAGVIALSIFAVWLFLSWQ